MPLESDYLLSPPNNIFPGVKYHGDAPACASQRALSVFRDQSDRFMSFDYENVHTLCRVCLFKLMERYQQHFANSLQGPLKTSEQQVKPARLQLITRRVGALQLPKTFEYLHRLRNGFYFFLICPMRLYQVIRTACKLVTSNGLN